MFDGWDFVPFCVAPLVGLGAAALMVAIASALRRRFPPFRPAALALAAAIVAASACYASFSLRLGEAEPDPWVEPSPGVVVGTWALAEETTQYLETFDHYTPPPHRLDILPGGQFEASKIPNFWVTLGDALPGQPTEFSGTGTWQVSSRSGKWVLLLSFRSTSLPDHPQEEVVLWFEGHFPPYLLAVRGGFDTLNPIFRFRKD